MVDSANADAVELLAVRLRETMTAVLLAGVVGLRQPQTGVAA